MDPQNFVAKLQQHMAELKPLKSPSNRKQNIFVHKDLKSCSHVFLLRIDRVKKALEPPYEGPYTVQKRENNSTQQQERTTQLVSRNETTQLVSRNETAQLCTDVDRLRPPTTPITAYNAYNRLQPPTTACNRLQPPTTTCTAYNRLHRLHRLYSRIGFF
ncbi:hypothetical protein TNCV_2275731, partial [Trichonephila clavipes]